MNKLFFCLVALCSVCFAQYMTDSSNFVSDSALKATLHLPDKYIPDPIFTCEHSNSNAAAIVAILAGTVAIVATFIDANAVEEFPISKTETLKIPHEWQTAHTIYFSLSIGVILSAIAALK